ncbi:MAG TPA: DUF2059 domain-containing protein [Verrucomicrobiae bacterium]|nr:DUF2059 domain-containing protein [Verrucomicrobiae bacterium]
MKTLSIILTAIVLAFAVSTHAAPPTDASIEQLLELTQTGKMMDAAFNQMDGFMKANMKQITKGETLTADQQAIMEKQQAKTLAIIKDELSWDKMKDSFVQVYRDTFSQEEIDGLIAFYKSPTGRAFVAKQPELMKNTMTMLQQHMTPMMEKIKEMTVETAQEIKAAKPAN